MPLPKKLDPNESKNFFQNLNGTDSVELKQYSYSGSVAFFDRLRFQVQIEKKQLPFTVTKLKNVHNGVFTHHPNKYDCIFGP